MLDYEEQQKAVKDAIALFPETFGLRAFPGDVFRISETHSYYGQGYSNDWGTVPAQVMLYTEILSEDGKWLSFCKGSIQELKRAIG